MCFKMRVGWSNFGLNFKCYLVHKIGMVQKDYSIDFLPLFMFLSITSVLPIIYPLK